MNDNGFTRRVWKACAIAAFLIITILLLKETFNVLLLVLAGALIAVYFIGLASLIQRKTNWKAGICTAISVLATMLIIAVLFWLIGAKVETQIEKLSDTLPGTIQNAREQLNNTTWGRRLSNKLSSNETRNQLQSVAQTFFKSTFGVLGDVYVVLFLGIFFTVSPKLYTGGIVRLVPPHAQKYTVQVLQKLGSNLRKWLKGKLFAMLVVAVLTGIGLLIIGVPMWLALAIIAGILNFIPNFGPLIALIPAVLVALMNGPATAAWVVGLYMLVQVLESNFITPTVQKKLVNIPPAMIIIAQLLIAPLTGGWGLLVATPLLLIVMTLVQELYIKRTDENQ